MDRISDPFASEILSCPSLNLVALSGSGKSIISPTCAQNDQTVQVCRALKRVPDGRSSARNWDETKDPSN